MSNMRIALINQPWDASLPPRQTSLAIWSYQVARRLAASCDVVVYGQNDGRGRSEEVIDGVCYRHINSALDRRLLPWLEKVSGFRPVRRPLVSSSWYFRGYARQVAEDLRARDCHFAMMFNFSQFVPIIRRIHPPVTLALNMQCEWLSQFDKRILETRLRHVDQVFGCSAYIADKVRARFPELGGCCRAVFNGVDVGHFAVAADGRAAPPAGPPRLLFVGRVSPEKGVHVLLDALAMVLKEVPEARLDIVGSNAPCPREYIVDLADDDRVRDLARFYNGKSYWDQLHEQARLLGISEQVNFAGFVPHAQARDFYRHAALLVNPSLSEAFGMSLAEGMASGLPVVAGRVGGMVEIVTEGETGLFAEPGDADSLAAAMLTLLKDESLRRRMGEAGRARAARLFSWDAIAAQVLDICRTSPREIIDADATAEPAIVG